MAARLGLLKQRGHIVPELAPLPALVVGQPAQCRRPPDGGEDGVNLPAPQMLPHRLLRGRFRALRQLPVQCQVLAQPGQGLPPQPQSLIVGQVLGVMSLAGSGPRRSRPRGSGVGG